MRGIPIYTLEIIIRSCHGLHKFARIYCKTACVAGQSVSIGVICGENMILAELENMFIYKNHSVAPTFKIYSFRFTRQIQFLSKTLNRDYTKKYFQKC